MKWRPIPTVGRRGRLNVALVSKLQRAAIFKAVATVIRQGAAPKIREIRNRRYMVEFTRDVGWDQRLGDSGKTAALR